MATLCLLVGVPVLLATLVGWPLPTTLPSVDSLENAARTGISDQVIVNTLAVIAWLAWAQLALALMVEILAVARHLARARSPEDLARIRARLAAQAERVEHLDDEARWSARIPCALLDGAGHCSVHPARPLRCRAFHSCDVDPCRAAFEGQPGTEPVRIPRLDRANDAAEAGYDAALVEAGLSAEGYRLEIGLLVALEDPGAGERWRAGEPAFARARGR